MIELWKTLKTAETQATALYNAAETAWTAASAVKLANAAAPDPVHPSEVISALPAIRAAIGSVEGSMGRAAVAGAKQQLDATLKATLAAPASPPPGVT